MRLKLKTAPAAEPFTLNEAKNQLRVEVTTDDALITSLIKTVRQIAESETKRALITQTWKMYLDTESGEIEIPRPPLQSIESIKTISSTESTVDQNSASGQAILYVASTTGFAADDTVVINRDGAREEEVIVLTVQDGISLTMTTNLTETHTAAQADRVEKYTLVDTVEYNVDPSVDSPGRVKLRTGSNWPIHRNFASFIIEFKAGYGDTAADIPDKFKQGILIIMGHLYENRGGEGVVKARVQAIEEARILFAGYKIHTL